jgi:bacterioferritin
MSADLNTPRRVPPHSFLSNVVEIRRRARSHIASHVGSHVDGSGGNAAADRDAVVRLLNTALATEMLCVVRYRRHPVTDSPALAETLRNRFVERALEEQGHADRIVARIVELGGEPNPDPPHSANDGDADGDGDGGDEQRDDDADDESLVDMLAEDLIVERIAIDTYREIIRYVGDSDIATRRLFESIVTIEQQQAAALASLRENIQRQARAAAGPNRRMNDTGGHPERAAEHAVGYAVGETR